MASHRIVQLRRPLDLLTRGLAPASLLVAAAAAAGCGDAGEDSESTMDTLTTAPTGPTAGPTSATMTGGATETGGASMTGGGESESSATGSTTVGMMTAGPTSVTNATDSTTEGGTDTGPCFEECSADLKAVVDCNGEIVQACQGAEGCNPQTLECVDPCEAAEQSKSSIGCEYYATMMHTFEDNPCFAAFVANTWDAPAHLEVEYEGQSLPVGDFTYLPDGVGPNLVYDPYDDVGGLQPGEVAILFLGGPTSAMDDVNCPHESAMPNGTQIKGTGVASSFRITSDVPVTAYQINPYGGGSAAVTGASLLLPTSVWDDNYVVANAYQYFAPRVPSFNVVAREDNTTVVLKPVAAVAGGGGLPSGGAGQPLQFTIDAGEHAQFSQQAELTGSVLQSDKPIGVMGGHECMRVPLGEEWCDHGEQMIPPVRALGSEYVGVMHQPRVDEDSFWRIVGAVDGTQLTWSDNVGGPSTLDQGELVEFITGDAFVVSSQDDDHPFMLFNVMSGNGWIADNSGYGDPDFVLSYPPGQYGNRYVFFADPTYPETSLTVVRMMDGGDFHDVELDCAGTIGGWQAVGDFYEWTRVQLITGDFQPVGGCTTGRHEMSSDGPFGVWVWGWGTPESQIPTINVSYGYPGGMNVELINDVIVVPE
ncbi:MAG: hypothetical protein H6713_16840 [Myxococcales bacterium]|nr:hypothetical protein [Myxococcales bacterium]